MNGGYINVDFNGLNLLAESAQTITGLYEEVQTAMKTGKPIYACNMLWGDVPITPVQVFAVQTAANTVTCTASTLQVVVTSADSVTIVNMVTANRSAAKASK